ncbi:hypothetical protein EXIGLDRAFT_99113 [Exidia glandulosa HHB12029]|uniref:Uncharacterized protein n=1 Tax=Exidia glandulosa HHB12029 TaxID=1314781 RepID=A0A165NPY7_EXIGL|nr:hypothetical protein EXIGLDRAFT_99113 [Exidia glandulosa HHB12029]
MLRTASPLRLYLTEMPDQSCSSIATTSCVHSRSMASLPLSAVPSEYSILLHRLGQVQLGRAVSSGLLLTAQRPALVFVPEADETLCHDLFSAINRTPVTAFMFSRRSHSNLPCSSASASAPPRSRITRMRPPKIRAIDV